MGTCVQAEGSNFWAEVILRPPPEGLAGKEAAWVEGTKLDAKRRQKLALG